MLGNVPEVCRRKKKENRVSIGNKLEIDPLKIVNKFLFRLKHKTPFFEAKTWHYVLCACVHSISKMTFSFVYFCIHFTDFMLHYTLEVCFYLSFTKPYLLCIYTLCIILNGTHCIVMHIKGIIVENDGILFFVCGWCCKEKDITTPRKY